MNGTLRTCEKGHRFYKSSDCPTCPVCAELSRPDTGFLSLLSGPARRALEKAGITTLSQLSGYSEKEILALHGVGPSTIPILTKSLMKEGLSFRSAK